ncbi:hypothetical protein KIPB_011532, partial [Kipferlia bialata]
SYFSVDNPMASAGCACGESFVVEGFDGEPTPCSTF